MASCACSDRASKNSKAEARKQAFGKAEKIDARPSGLFFADISARGCGQSQRDCVLQPRVARHELPWVSSSRLRQPQRGCGRVDRREVATPLGLEKSGTTFTQGSSCLATLGFGPESLWDSSADAISVIWVMTRANARAPSRDFAGSK